MQKLSEHQLQYLEQPRTRQYSEERLQPVLPGVAEGSEETPPSQEFSQEQDKGNQGRRQSAQKDAAQLVQLQSGKDKGR